MSNGLSVALQHIMGSSKAMREIIVEQDLESQPTTAPELELEAQSQQDLGPEVEPEPEAQPIAVDHMWLAPEPEPEPDAVTTTVQEGVLPPPPLAEPPVVESEGSSAAESMVAPQVVREEVTEENEELVQ